MWSLEINHSCEQRPGEKDGMPKGRAESGLSCRKLVGCKSPLWDGRHGGSKRSHNEADGILIARQMA